MSYKRLVEEIDLDAADFNIKSKDVLDFYKELGIEKSSGGSIDSEEFDLLVRIINYLGNNDLGIYKIILEEK